MTDTNQKKVQITIPSDTVATFSNIAQVTVLDDSVILQFAYLRPNTTTGKLVSEIALSPKHAIEFNRALDATIKRHFTRHLNDAGQNNPTQEDKSS